MKEIRFILKESVGLSRLFSSSVRFSYNLVHALHAWKRRGSGHSPYNCLATSDVHDEEETTLYIYIYIIRNNL